VRSVAADDKVIRGELFDLEVTQRMLTALHRLNIDSDIEDVSGVLSRWDGIPMHGILRELAEPLRDVPVFFIALPAIEICLTIQWINP